MIQQREQYELKLDCAQSISIWIRFLYADTLIGNLIGRVKLMIYCERNTYTTLCWICDYTEDIILGSVR